ncbi:MAG: lysophospholipid acyltransferase family protein [Pseudomonadota bacterium]
MFHGLTATMNRSRFLFLVLATLFFTLLAFAFFWARYTFLKKLNIDYYLMRAWGKTLTYIYGIKREIVIDENSDTNSVGIYIAPHSSFWDIIILGSELKGFFVSKKEVVKWPVIGLGAKFVRTVFIDRAKGVSSLKALQNAGKRTFDSGHSLIMFPEGTRSYEHMQNIKPGPFHLSVTTGKPIKPIIIKYTPRENIVPRRKGNFVMELVAQSVSAPGTVATVELMQDIYPDDFNSVDEFKEHVRKIMDERYNAGNCSL